MSIGFGMSIAQESRAVLLQNFEEEFAIYHQGAIREAAAAGEEWLVQNAGEPGHTPYATGNLLATVQKPIQNQYSVTFRIGGTLMDASGRMRPYGFAQEDGWHQATKDGVVFHEGQHMVQHAAEVGAQAYLAFIGFTEGGNGSAVVGLGRHIYGPGANPGFQF